MLQNFDMTDLPNEEALEAHHMVETGKYHLWVNKGVLTQEGALKVEFLILAGTTPGQEQRTFSQMFFPPLPSHKDGGFFARKVWAKLFLSTGVVMRNQLGTAPTIDLDRLGGSQLVAEVQHEKNDNKVFPRIPGLEMYSPFQKEVAKVPKHPSALAMIPAPLRDQWADQGTIGTANTSAAVQSPPPPPAPPSAPVTAPVGPTPSAPPVAAPAMAQLPPTAAAATAGKAPSPWDKL